MHRRVWHLRFVACHAFNETHKNNHKYTCMTRQFTVNNQCRFASQQQVSTAAVHRLATTSVAAASAQLFRALYNYPACGLTSRAPDNLQNEQEQVDDVEVQVECRKDVFLGRQRILVFSTNHQLSIKYQVLKAVQYISSVPSKCVTSLVIMKWIHKCTLKKLYLVRISCITNT